MKSLELMSNKELLNNLVSNAAYRQHLQERTGRNTASVSIDIDRIISILQKRLSKK